jgi:DNA-nicking Smr family endonuclease
MAIRKRAPSRAERQLWQLAIRDAVPFAGRAPLSPLPDLAAPALPDPPAVATPPRSARSAPNPVALPELTYVRTPGLDRRSSERLKRGQMPIEARLDLHGMTQDAARRMLDGFIAGAANRGLRAVLIITGKGLRVRAPAENAWTGDDLRPGVLRSAVPRWLNESPSRARVLAFTEAQPRDGGSGALYILLRRIRE